MTTTLQGSGVMMAGGLREEKEGGGEPARTREAEFARALSSKINAGAAGKRKHSLGRRDAEVASRGNQMAQRQRTLRRLVCRLQGGLLLLELLLLLLLLLQLLLPLMLLL